MLKIIVIGNTGSGKSTFSKILGKKLNLPVIHLDTYFHKKNFIQVSREEWDKIIEEFINREKWIMDGNYKRTLDKRINSADVVIFLDLPKWLSLYRILKRRLSYRGTTRPDMPEYLKERLTFMLIKKCLLFSRKTILEILSKHKDTKRIFILKNTKDMDSFLNKIK
ncbi:MAG: AAA family ATPase [Candidatus Levybacteria bacterium]|nr:AAA family ATPase [Candidatus Levybacteria bacterium]